MPFAKQTAPHASLRLRALFTGIAMGISAAASPVLAAPVMLQPRVASPQQLQQYDDLAAELAAREAPYVQLQQKFDLGQLTAEEYRAAVAALDARQAQAPASTAVPDILRPHITGCTKDGYSVNIPVGMTIDIGEFSKNFDPKQPRGQAALQMLQRIDQSLQATLRNTNVRLIAKSTKDEVLTPEFKTAVDAALAKFSTDMSAQTRLGIKAEAQGIETASMANCLIQPDQAAAPVNPAVPAP